MVGRRGTECAASMADATTPPTSGHGQTDSRTEPSLCRTRTGNDVPPKWTLKKALTQSASMSYDSSSSRRIAAISPSMPNSDSRSLARSSCGSTPQGSSGSDSQQSTSYWLMPCSRATSSVSRWRASRVTLTMRGFVSFRRSSSRARWYCLLVTLPITTRVVSRFMVGFLSLTIGLSNRAKHLL